MKLKLAIIFPLSIVLVVVSVFVTIMVILGNQRYGLLEIKNIDMGNDVVEKVPDANMITEDIAVTISESSGVENEKTVVEFEGVKSYKVAQGDFVYYLDTSLYSDEEDMDRYIKRLIEGNQRSYDFLQDYFGLSSPYEDNVVVVRVTKDGRGSYQVDNRIVTSWDEPLDSRPIGGSGNSHELMHLLMDGTYRGTHAWEEGLADYVEHYERHGSDYDRWFFSCSDDGWTSGEEFVAYTNFLEPKDPNAPFYAPQHPSSFYRSGECFWIYVIEVYGEESMKEIVRRWATTRASGQTKKFIEDIVNPVLGADLRDLVYSRYHYFE